MRGITMRYNLMRARCKYCGRNLRYANLPNRGPVMVHASGDGAACRRLIESGRDIVTRELQRKEAEAERAERLAQFKNGVTES